MPLGLDALVIVLAAKHDEIFWIFPPLVTAVSLAGAMLTYWIGRTIGYAGLPRFVAAGHLERMKACLDRTGVAGLAAAALMPPPFPLSAFLLTCGALGFDRRRFVLVFGTMRLIRFGTEALLARHYGEQLLQLLEADGLHRAVIASVIVLSAMAIASGVVFWSRIRPQPA